MALIPCSDRKTKIDVLVTG